MHTGYMLVHDISTQERDFRRATGAALFGNGGRATRRQIRERKGRYRSCLPRTTRLYRPGLDESFWSTFFDKKTNRLDTRLEWNNSRADYNHYQCVIAVIASVPVPRYKYAINKRRIPWLG